jgi:hypothetical protein
MRQLPPGDHNPNMRWVHCPRCGGSGRGAGKAKICARCLGRGETPFHRNWFDDDRDDNEGTRNSRNLDDWSNWDRRGGSEG